MAKKKKPSSSQLWIPAQLVERRIYLIRGQKVMLDSDLAELYGVPTRRLNEQVDRNITRFPEDFMFRLSREEAQTLRSQIAILKTGRGQHRKYVTRAFTEHGILMLSSVLRSERAVQVNIAIMRAFVRLREILATHKDLARKIEALETKDLEHDAQFKVVFDAIRQLMAPPAGKKKRIGFKP
jgi:phage regulator Rha-like protein